jgi:hypothetical protein
MDSLSFDAREEQHDTGQKRDGAEAMNRWPEPCMTVMQTTLSSRTAIPLTWINQWGSAWRHRTVASGLPDQIDRMSGRMARTRITPTDRLARRQCGFG